MLCWGSQQNRDPGRRAGRVPARRAVFDRALALRTTAELVIGLLPEWRFSREHDPATSYAELRISPRVPG